MLSRGPHRMLLRVTPAIPCALDGALDQLQPFVIARTVRRRRQGQQLPQPVLTDDRDNRLAARPPSMAIGAWVVRVGGHQSLLDGEDQIVCGMEGRGRQRWI
jgi:hypothetical protein